MVDQVKILNRLTGVNFVLSSFPSDLFRLSFRSNWQTPCEQVASRMVVVEVIRDGEWTDFSTVREEDFDSLSSAVLSPRIK